jgi:hypothetical protein
MSIELNFLTKDKERINGKKIGEPREHGSGRCHATWCLQIPPSNDGAAACYCFPMRLVDSSRYYVYKLVEFNIWNRGGTIEDKKSRQDRGRTGPLVAARDGFADGPSATRPNSFTHRGAGQSDGQNATANAVDKITP